jgi:glutamate synthase (ferredoxin)
MSGGIAFVLDEKDDLKERTNMALVSMESVSDAEDISRLKSLIEAHRAATGSTVAEKVLSNFDAYVSRFKKVVPLDYKRIIASIKLYSQTESDPEAAELKAFQANSVSRGK